VFCGTLLGTRRWAASIGDGGTDDIGVGSGVASPLGLDPDCSRDDGWKRCVNGAVGNARFLKDNGVVSAGPMLLPGLPESLTLRGDVRLNAAAEIVRVPGGSGVEERDEEELFVGPVRGDRLPGAGKR